MKNSEGDRRKQKATKGDRRRQTIKGIAQISNSLEKETAIKKVEQEETKMLHIHCRDGAETPE